MKFREKVGIGVIGLVLIAGGFGLSELLKIPKGNISSTTTIMPPAANNSTPLTLTMTSSGNKFQPARLYIQNPTGAQIAIRFGADLQNIMPSNPDGWLLYTIQPPDGADPVNVTITVRGNGAETFVVNRAPATGTNSFTGLYSGSLGNSVIIVAGDANLFKL